MENTTLLLIILCFTSIIFSYFRLKYESVMTYKRINELNKNVKDLDIQLWAMENKPKYVVGDIVRYQISPINKYGLIIDIKPTNELYWQYMISPVSHWDLVGLTTQDGYDHMHEYIREKDIVERYFSWSDFEDKDDLSKQMKDELTKIINKKTKEDKQ